MRGTTMMIPRTLSTVLIAMLFSQRVVRSLAFCPLSEQEQLRCGVPRQRRVARVLVPTVLHQASRKGPDDFFSVYNDDELWNVLNIHRQLTNQQQQDEVVEETKTPPMSIHESFLKSQGEETMESLLNLHESLTKGETQKAMMQREELLSKTNQVKVGDASSDIAIPTSLHDLVQEAVGAATGATAAANIIKPSEVDNVSTSDDDAPAAQEPLQHQWNDDMLQRIANIRAVASDVDGTLLTSKQSLHPRSRQAVLRAVRESPNDFFLATGKSRKGALNSLGVEMTALLDGAPGVFLQGLYCVDGKGHVVFEKKLTNEAVRAVEKLANECNVSLVGYDGDSLYSTTAMLTESVRSLSERYGEPAVVALPTATATPFTDYEPGFHKFLLVDENVDMLTTTVRSKLDTLAETNEACVTQAVPTMLEWLPEGCSKAMGVSKLCESIGIDPSTQLLAIGDAENDVDMLRMASIGVAVGNANSVAQEAADFLLQETNDEGGAGAAMELFGFGIPNTR